MENSNEKYVRGLLALGIIASSVVGGVFGYYGGIISHNPSAAVNIIKSSSPKNTLTSITDESSRVVDIVKKYSPAVVSIVATKDLPVVEQYNTNPFQAFCNDPFFAQFFGGCDLKVPQYRQNGTRKQEVSAGTGFVVKQDGLILTNKHVVDVQGAEYTVILNDGRKFPARVMARDPIQDLAIIKIETAGLATVKLANSDTLEVGQTVIAIGNALGEYRNTVSKGVVSGLKRDITAGGAIGQAEQLSGVIQTDAAINPGNSGGPLLNLKGEAIGVNVAIVQGSQNIAFSLPINDVRKVIDSVEKYGKILRPWIGVRYVMVNKELKDKNQLPVDYGVLVVRGETNTDLAVVPGSPADKAGIVELAWALKDLGFRFIADSKTAATLRQAELEASDVSEHPGLLHALAAAGQTGIREKSSPRAPSLSLVAINLYPLAELAASELAAVLAIAPAARAVYRPRLSFSWLG